MMGHYPIEVDFAAMELRIASMLMSKRCIIRRQKVGRPKQELHSFNRAKFWAIDATQGTHCLTFASQAEARRFQATHAEFFERSKSKGFNIWIEGV